MNKYYSINEFSKILGVSESYNYEDEVKELSIKDLYYDEISKSLAMKEAKALEEDGKKPDEQQASLDPQDEKPEPDQKDEPKDDEVKDPEGSQEEGEGKGEEEKDEDLKAKVAELEKEVARLQKEVQKLEGSLSKEKETREAVELKYLEVKKQQRVALAEKVNEMRTSLGLEGEDIEILSKSTEEALNTKIEVLKEFMCSGPELAKSLPQVKSEVPIDESVDNTIKDNNRDKKDSNRNIEMQMKEKYKNFFKR